MYESSLNRRSSPSEGTWHGGSRANLQLETQASALITIGLIGWLG
jgi:hypothetical protein